MDSGALKEVTETPPAPTKQTPTPPDPATETPDQTVTEKSATTTPKTTKGHKSK